MDFQILSIQGAILALTFFFCGIIDAVCGGGGLLSMPMFMAIGFPAHVVTGTNQCSIFFGSATSLARYVKAKRIHWPTAWLAGPLAVLGAFLGARLNLIMPERILEIVMIVLLPIVTIVILMKPNFGTVNRVHELGRRQYVLASLFIGIVIGGYQGFYGAGSGTFFFRSIGGLFRAGCSAYRRERSPAGPAGGTARFGYGDLILQYFAGNFRRHQRSVAGLAGWRGGHCAECIAVFSGVRAVTSFYPAEFSGSVLLAVQRQYGHTQRAQWSHVRPGCGA